MRSWLRIGSLGSMVVAVLTCWYVQEGMARGKRDKAPLPPVRAVGDLTAFAALEPYRLDNVGLVVGLKGTGSNPAPSPLRARLLEEMHRQAGVDDKQADALLASPETALVLVRAYVPGGARKGDTLDVEVLVPPGSDTTSLRGGWLLETDLSQIAQIRGRIHDGDVLARASGPIVVFPQTAGKAGASQRRGRILGGAKVLHDRNLAVVLADRYESVPTAVRIQRAINRRFHDVPGAITKGAATAKNDEYLELRIAEPYRYNIPRYLTVVRHLAISETAAERHQRMEQIEQFLLSQEVREYPGAVMSAALQLEGMGSDGRRVLERVLSQSQDVEVRFFAAEALAYLGEPSSAKELGRAARDEPAFRVFALAALVALGDPVAAAVLRELMDGPSAELRYGAFRALWTRSPDELAGRNVYNKFWLHAVPTQGPPMVHVTWNFRPEVVLFGPEQRLLTPAFLTAGPEIVINASADAEEVVIKRFSDTGPPQEQRCSLRLSDVLETVVALGAGYPDVVELLSQAQEQHNLQGRLWIEAIPRPGRLTARWRRLLEETEGEQQAGLLARLPGLFPGTASAPGSKREQESASPDDDGGSDDAAAAKPPAKRRRFLGKLFNRSGD